MALQANALTTVARVKALPGLSGKSDSEVEEQINLASDLIEEFLGYPLGYRESTRLLQGSGSRELVLPVAPIVELLEILVLDQEIDLAEVTMPHAADGDWAELGKLYRRAGWPIETVAGNWAGDPDFSATAFPISVKLRHGWWLPSASGTKPSDVPALPDRIRRACELTCNLAFRSPAGDHPRIKSEATAGGYKVEFAQAGEVFSRWDLVLPEKARLYLERYCRRDFLL